METGAKELLSILRLVDQATPQKSDQFFFLSVTWLKTITYHIWLGIIIQIIIQYANLEILSMSAC